MFGSAIQALLENRETASHRPELPPPSRVLSETDRIRIQEILAFAFATTIEFVQAYVKNLQLIQLYEKPGHLEDGFFKQARITKIAFAELTNLFHALQQSGRLTLANYTFIVIDKEQIIETLKMPFKHVVITHLHYSTNADSQESLIDNGFLDYNKYVGTGYDRGFRRLEYCVNPYFAHQSFKNHVLTSKAFTGQVKPTPDGLSLLYVWQIVKGGGSIDVKYRDTGRTVAKPVKFDVSWDGEYARQYPLEAELPVEFLKKKTGLLISQTPSGLKLKERGNMPRREEIEIDLPPAVKGVIGKIGVMIHKKPPVSEELMRRQWAGTLSVACGINVESVLQVPWNPNLLKPCAPNTIMHGFNSKVELTEEAMRNCLLPILSAKNCQMLNLVDMPPQSNALVVLFDSLPFLALQSIILPRLPTVRELAVLSTYEQLILQRNPHIRSYLEFIHVLQNPRYLDKEFELASEGNSTFQKFLTEILQNPTHNRLFDITLTRCSLTYGIEKVLLDGHVNVLDIQQCNCSLPVAPPKEATSQKVIVYAKGDVWGWLEAEERKRKAEQKAEKQYEKDRENVLCYFRAETK